MAKKATSKKVAAKTSVNKATRLIKSTTVKTKNVSKQTNLPTAAIMRIAKASGAERVGADGAATILMFAEEYLARLVREATKLAADAGRKTLKGDDVENASKTI